MKKNLLIAVLIGAFVIALSSKANAEGTHEFVGVKKCQMCHKKADIGDQYDAWLQSKHSKAYEALGTDLAKKAGKERGVDDPQKSGKCLKCHSTAYNFTEAKVTENIPVEEGVSCESCHSAGKDYMKKSVMENKDDAIANGLLMPDEKNCIKCHNTESPQYKEFKYAEFYEQIKHPMPKK